ncbi:MAG: hypothetical protein V1887_02280 [Candidatus Aenigmatarchaeota archaeon]
MRLSVGKSLLTARKAMKEAWGKSQELARYQVRVSDFLDSIHANTDAVEVSLDYEPSVLMPGMEGMDVNLGGEGEEKLRMKTEYVGCRRMKLCVKSVFTDVADVPFGMVLDFEMMGREIRPDDIVVRASLPESSDPKKYKYGGYDIGIRIRGRSVEFTGIDEGKRQVYDGAYANALMVLEAAARKHHLITKKPEQD